MCKNHRAFTAIELMAVLALIAVILGIVFFGFSSAREQARDRTRVGDIKSIALALEQYFSECKTYPPDIYDRSRERDCARSNQTFQNIMPNVPRSSSDQQEYHYVSLRNTPSGLCTQYHLAADLENTESPFLDEDHDFNSQPYSKCGGGSKFNGRDTNGSGKYDLSNKKQR